MLLSHGSGEEVHKTFQGEILAFLGENMPIRARGNSHYSAVKYRGKNH
jgi:hypothetical protein